GGSCRPGGRCRRPRGTGSWGPSPARSDSAVSSWDEDSPRRAAPRHLVGRRPPPLVDTASPLELRPQMHSEPGVVPWTAYRALGRGGGSVGGPRARDRSGGLYGPAVGHSWGVSRAPGGWIDAPPGERPPVTASVGGPRSGYAGPLARQHLAAL